MKNLMTTVAVVALLGLVGTAAMAANSDSHSVTVTVSAINELNVATGDAPAPQLTLTINAAVAGQDPTAVTNTSGATLEWTTNETGKKITVATDLAEPKFTLTALPTSVTGGTGVGTAVTLSTTAQDFVTAIATTTGGCGITYTGSATAAQGTGSDAHTVTYTLTTAL